VINHGYIEKNDRRPAYGQNINREMHKAAHYGESMPMKDLLENMHNFNKPKHFQPYDCNFKIGGLSEFERF
jgi:hypothetical protein